MSSAAVNASPEKSHHTEASVRSAAPRPVLAKQPRPAAAHNEPLAPTSPAATTIVSALAILPAAPAVAPSTPAQALALQSSYGNAAVARAASTGELKPSAAIAEPASKSAAPPAESPSTKSAVAAPTSASQTPGNAASPAAPLAAQTLPATGAASAAPTVAPDAVAASASTTTAASTPSAGGSAPTGKSSGPAALAAKPAEKGAVAHAGGGKHETDQHAKPAPAAAGSAGASGARSRSAASDPAFQSVVKHAKAVAHHQATHGSAKGKAAEASAAAVPPGNEVSSRAAARQTATMDAQKPKRFNREAFKSSLLGKIKAPSTLKEADNFKENNNLAEVKTSVNSQVADQKQQSQGALPQKVAENPDTSGIDPKPVTPLPDAGIGQGQGVAATGAAPKPADNSEVDLSAGPKEVDKQMSDAQVTDEQLEKSNEPAFQSAAGEKKNLQKQSAEAPREYRKQEKTALVASAHQAQAIANKHTHEMHGARKHALTAVSAHQAHAKEEEEKKRKEVSDHIESIYQKVKGKVEARLAQLDKDVNKTFDDGADGARAAFESYVELRMDAYKDDRYSGITGKARWVKDKFLGMPDFVNTFYEKGKDLFIQHMSEVIDRVATLVESGLNESMDIIASGKAEIDHYVNVELPSNLKSFGQKAATGIQSKFESLEQSVNDKQDQLAESLAQKYSENMEKLNSRIEEMKAANRGLVDAVLDAVVGVIKTILQLKDMLLNVLSRAASAIGMIIAHPIDFLGNLVEAGKQGFSNFVDHILEHLKQGFMEWLFGAVAETGIQLPKNFDLPGILSLVLQVLGLTYSNIRSRAVKILGEKVVKALETAAEIFKILITKGPGGLWEYIKEKIGDLKSMVIEKIKSFIMEKVVMAGITWIIGLLNPASAFIKACKAIYDIIMFFVEHGKQILDLVNAIIDSITAIAKGQIGAAAAWVEKSLARTIPVVIGFLAGLLGVGGISEKIKEVIEMVRKPINEAIDWVITKAVDLVKAVGGLLGFGKKDDKKDENGPDGPAIDVSFDMSGKQHTLSMTESPGAVMEMASTNKTPLSAKIGAAVTKLKQKGPQAGGDEDSHEKQVKALQKIEARAQTEESKPAKKGTEKERLSVVTEMLAAYAAEFKVTDIGDILASEGFPLPEVGEYSSLKGGEPLPDGKIREAHHAPPVEFGVFLGQAMQQAGGELQRKPSEDAAQIGDDLAEAGKSLSDAADGHGPGLSAILVHQDTHRTHGGASRIHGSEIREDLVAKLKADNIDLDDVAQNKAGVERVSVKPGESAFGRQVQSIGQSVAGGSRKPAVKTALKKHGREVVERAYKGEEARSIGAVEVALKTSAIDGPDARMGKVKDLRALAKEKWEDLLSKIF